MKLIDGVKRKKRLTESRQKLKDIIQCIWLNVILKAKHNCCPMKSQHNVKEGWPKDVVVIVKFLSFVICCKVGSCIS